MGKALEIGDQVIYVDSLAREHFALVTNVWPGMAPAVSDEPGCNVVFVSGDGSKTDPYGRQLERATSVVHKGKQPAHGNYWKRVDEVVS